MPSIFTDLPTVADSPITSSLNIKPEAQMEPLADQSSFDFLMNSFEHNTLSETFYDTEDKKKSKESNPGADLGVARGLVLNGVASSN
ncbi:MAG: hypothetical protein V4629_04620 [Pseudomonadota bacterium]